ALRQDLLTVIAMPSLVSAGAIALVLLAWRGWAGRPRPAMTAGVRSLLTLIVAVVMLGMVAAVYVGGAVILRTYHATTPVAWQMLYKQSVAEGWVWIDANVPADASIGYTQLSRIYPLMG